MCLQIQEIIEMHKKGISNLEISQKMNLSSGIVSTKLRPYLRKQKQLVNERIMELHNKGLTNIQISKEVGIRHETVGRKLKQLKRNV